MFRRENMKWTVPLLAAAVLCVVVLIHPAPMVRVEAQAAPTPMGLEGLIDAMQARADGLPGLSGVLGMRMTAPEEGGWKGVPFLYRAPNCYVRQDGFPMASLEEEPRQQDNAWLIFKDGFVYSRRLEQRIGGWLDDDGKAVSWTERVPTVMARPGDTYRGFGCGTGADALLMVNLMPRAWLEPFEGDTEAGPIEEVDGKSYYTLLDVKEPLEGSDQLVTWPSLWQRRTPRKYYINTESFVCERLVWGSVDEEEPFANAVRDVVAGGVQAVGGAELPTVYTLRLFGPSGVHFALEARLEGLEVKDAASVGEASFDAYALAGPTPVILRPTMELTDLEDYVGQHRSDVGAWLTLVDLYLTTQQVYRARDAYEAAMALVGESPPADFAMERERLWHDLHWWVVRTDLQLAPQEERIFAERAERFRQRGDAKKAAQMEARAQQYRQVKEAAMADAVELGISVEGLE